jgi:hypothetical protein
MIEADEVDFAAVDPALVVDHLEVGQFRPADHAPRRGRPAIGHGLANLDFRVGDAWGVLGPGRPEALGGIGSGGRSGLQQETARDHAVPPG